MTGNKILDIPVENMDFIEANIAYAKKLARRFFSARRNLGVDVEDFEGAALLGLCDAARLYDRARNTSFQTFCFRRIWGAMVDMLREGAGVSRRDFHSVVVRADKEEYPIAGKRYNKDVPYSMATTPQQLFALSGVLEEVGIQIYYNPDNDSVDFTYSDLMSPECISVMKSLRQKIEMLIEQLPDNQRTIIKGYYWEEAQDGTTRLSRGWASRLRRRALNDLRKMLEKNLSPLDYL